MEPTCIEYFTIPLHIEVTSCGIIQNKQEMENLIYMTLGKLGEINIPNAMASFKIVSSLPVCPKCKEKMTDVFWNDYDWYPNPDGLSGEKVGSRHRHFYCKCGHSLCERTGESCDD